MIKILTFAGAIAFIAASLAVGIRLLLLARRTRQLPELLIGLAFFTGAVSYLLSAVVNRSDLTGAPAVLLGLVGRTCFITAPVAMAFVAWRVFRPQRPWAGVAVGALLAINLLYIVRPFLVGGLQRSELTFHPLYWITTAGQILPWLWVALESLHLHRQLRRRARLGLADDSALAYRMLLWAVGVGAVALLTVTLELLGLAAVLGLARIPMSPFIIVLGLAGATSLWLAFFPPAALVRRLGASAAAAG